MTDAATFDLDSLPPFEGKTRADWMLLVEKGLRGANMDSLASRTEDGLQRGPLTTLTDRPAAPAAIMRSGAPLLAGRPWHICAPVRDPDLAFANQQLLEDLEGGASAARITLGKAGLPIRRAADFERLFDRVHTDLIPLQFENTSAEHADMLMSLPKLKSAHLSLDLESIPENCPETWRVLTVDAAKVQNDGGTDVTELAYMAASVAGLMKTHGAKRAARHISLQIAVDRDAHMTIAKTRAARRIYARIAETFGLSDLSAPLYAVSSKRMMQSVDPWTNMLRTMSAGFGAIIGGADYVTLLPFTQALGTPTPFGHRISRNMQLMMMEESHLGQVADAAHGSYFHEHMTDELAQAAWTKFQEIEALGGIEAYENGGDLAADITRARAFREKQAEPIVGVTLHKADNIRKAKVRKAAP